MITLRSHRGCYKPFKKCKIITSLPLHVDFFTNNYCKPNKLKYFCGWTIYGQHYLDNVSDAGCPCEKMWHKHETWFDLGSSRLQKRLMISSQEQWKFLTIVVYFSDCLSDVLMFPQNDNIFRSVQYYMMTIKGIKSRYKIQFEWS